MSTFKATDVRHVHWNRLTNPQLAALFVSVGWPTVPSKKARVAKLLQFLERADDKGIAKLQRAYDVAILKKKDITTVDDAVVDAVVAKMAASNTPVSDAVIEDILARSSVKLNKLVAHINSLKPDQVGAIVDRAVGAMQEGSIKYTAAAAKQLRKDAAEILAAEASKHRPLKIVSPGKKSRTVKGVLPEEFESLVQLASQRVPIMMVGPAGCGKTFIAAKIAEALGLKFADQSCSEGVSESTFIGRLLPTGKGGQFEYTPSPFIEIYEKGGVFLLDEMDAADANLLVFLNKAIANDCFHLPQRVGNTLVKKHKDFVVVAAANTYGSGGDAQYVRNQLDAATLDRFAAGLVTMDYSAKVEEALVDPEILAWGRHIREAISAHQLRRIMSTRVMLDMTKMKLNCDWTKDDWDRAYFGAWSNSELRQVGATLRIKTR